MRYQHSMDLYGTQRRHINVYMPISHIEVCKRIDDICIHTVCPHASAKLHSTTVLSSLKLTAKAPTLVGRAPKGKDRIPTIHFLGRTVSFREGNSKTCSMLTGSMFNKCSKHPAVPLPHSLNSASKAHNPPVPGLLYLHNM